MSNMQAPPPRPTGGTIDFGRPFAFVFQDPDWVRKILIGGLMYLLAFLIIGMFFIFGYCARLARNVAAGLERPLPEWDRWGEDFAEGLKLAVIGFLYYLPMIVIIVVAFGGAGFLAAITGGESDAAAAAGSALAGTGMCLMWILILVVAVILPAALTLAIMRQSFGAAFQFGLIFSYIRANAVNYVLAIVVYLVASFLSQLGVLLLCVGVLFTGFWAQVVSVYAFADTYRLSPVK